MATGAVSLPVKAVYTFPNLGIRQTTFTDGTFMLELIKEKGTDTMSDTHARMRVVLDFPVDPSTASPRVMKALAKEAKEYAQVVLVKDREIVLTDHVEVIDVHVHKSTESEACATCVQKLAMDERQ